MIVFNTVKPRFTGPLGKRNKARSIEKHGISGWVHFTLIYTQSLFSGDRIKPGKSRDPVNRETVNRGFTVVVLGTSDDASYFLAKHF